MKTVNTIDAERQFIVYYYLSDDTIAVHELPARNSGKTEQNNHTCNSINRNSWRKVLGKRKNS